MISSSQRPLSDNTQQTNIHAHSGIRTHDLSRRAAVDLRLRLRGLWDRQGQHILITKTLYQFYKPWQISHEYSKLMSLACCSSGVDVGCIPWYKCGVALVMYLICSFNKLRVNEIKIPALSLATMNTKCVRWKDCALSLDHTVWNVNARKIRDIFSQKSLFKQWHVISIYLTVLQVS